MACVCTFSRASCRLGRITSSLIGLLVCLRPFWLAEVITLALVSRHSIETRSISVVVFGFMNFQLIQKKKKITYSHCLSENQNYQSCGKNWVSDNSKARVYILNMRVMRLFPWCIGRFTRVCFISSSFPVGIRQSEKGYHLSFP